MKRGRLARQLASSRAANPTFSPPDRARHVGSTPARGNLGGQSKVPFRTRRRAEAPRFRVPSRREKAPVTRSPDIPASAAVTTAGRDHREPSAELEPAVQSDPTSGSAWACLGRAYHDAGAHEPARAAFEQAVRLGPGSATHWFGLGRACLNTDDLQGALVAGVLSTAS